MPGGAKKKYINSKDPQGLFLKGVRNCVAYMVMLDTLRPLARGATDSKGLVVMVEDLCRSCYHEAEQIMVGEGPLATANAENARLRKCINQCNLSTMKEINALKGDRADADAMIADGLVTFHEPLQYLDTDTRQLVLEIVCDKLRQLEWGNAPPSLIEALIRTARSQGQGGDAGELREKLQEARALVADAEDRAQKLQDEMEATRKESHMAEVKVAKAVQASAELQVEVDRLKDYEAKAVQCEEALTSLECEAGQLREELEVYRQRDARKHEMVTQTDLTVEQLDKKEKEIKKLKVMLEELQMKTRELAQRCTRKGVEGVDGIVEDLGLGEVFSKDTVFQRLYNDAARRAQKLEQLREKIRADRGSLLGADAKDQPEIPVMEAVENSRLSGLQRMFRQAEAVEVSAPLAPPAPTSPTLRHPRGSVGGEDLRCGEAPLSPLCLLGRASVAHQRPLGDPGAPGDRGGGGAAAAAAAPSPAPPVWASRQQPRVTTPKTSASLPALVPARHEVFIVGEAQRRRRLRYLIH